VQSLQAAAQSPAGSSPAQPPGHCLQPACACGAQEQGLWWSVPAATLSIGYVGDWVVSSQVECCMHSLGNCSQLDSIMHVGEGLCWSCKGEVEGTCGSSESWFKSSS
jgi:hypothetical protein